MNNNQLATYIFEDFINAYRSVENNGDDLSQVSRGKYNDISNQRRHMIIAAHQRGDNAKDIANYEELSVSTIKSIIKKFEDSGSINKIQRGGAKRSKMTDEQREFISDEVDKNCAITLKSLRDLFIAKFGNYIGLTTIYDNLKRIDYSMKLLTPVPIRRNDEDTLISRRNYAREFLQLESQYPDECIYFVDEVGFSLAMHRRLGRSVIGHPANLVVKQLRSKNVSVCCAFNRKSLFYYDVNVKPYNNESFAGYINNFFQFLEKKH